MDVPDWLDDETAAWATALAARLHPAPTAPVIAGHGLRSAAVLVPVRVGIGLPEVMFLVRPQAMKTHAGQVAFPGGRVDADDASATAAALRETEEELGILRTIPLVLGALPMVTAPSGYSITPVVALLPSRVTVTPSPAEVDSHFSVPLELLQDPRQRRTMLGTRRGTTDATTAPLHFWVHTPAVIWGVTGHILDRFLDNVPARSDRR